MRTNMADAAKTGDLEALRGLLTEGANPEKWTEVYPSPVLIVAAEAGQLDAVSLLVEYGANVDGSTETGETALHHASRSGNLGLVRLLLTLGAKINAMAETGTPLILASAAGHIDCVDFLLDHGAELEVRDEVTGQTALGWAIQNEHREVVAKLERFVWDKTHDADGFPLTKSAFINFVQDLADRHLETTLSLEEYLRSLWGLLPHAATPNASFPLLAKLLADSFSALPVPYQEGWNSCTQSPKGSVPRSSKKQFQNLCATLLFQIADLHNMGEEIWNDPWKWFGRISPTGNNWSNFEVPGYLECATSGYRAHAKDLNTTQCGWNDLTLFLELGRLYE